jgi:hypothetical protein
VNLQYPEESLAKFPVDSATANQCREAWSAGVEVASHIEVKACVGKGKRGAALAYQLNSLAEQPAGRTRYRSPVYRLAASLALVLDHEIVVALQRVLREVSDATVKWLCADIQNMIQAEDSDEDPFATKVLGGEFEGVEHVDQHDLVKINSFTILQSFFMGYFYAVFGALLDTDALLIPVVEGAWGFRSLDFLHLMAMNVSYTNRISEDDKQPATTTRTLSSNAILEIMSRLFLCHEISTSSMDSFSTFGTPIGLVQTRALLLRSLVMPCHKLSEIGRFILLDMDASGVPTNKVGIVISGTGDLRRNLFEEEYPLLNAMKAISGTADATSHIEADWDQDPESTLLCVRYQGRRLRTLNPSLAELFLLKTITVPPGQLGTKTAEHKIKTPVKMLNWSINDFFTRSPATVEEAGILTELRMNIDLASHPVLTRFIALFYGFDGTPVFHSSALEGLDEDSMKVKVMRKVWLSLFSA